MTREEAIFTIEHRDGIMDYGETEQLAEALEIALEALKAEPCEDCVSREVALEAMRNLPHEYKTKEQRARTGGIAACQVIIENLPPVIPKPRTGHWIRNQHLHFMYDWKCSECGHVEHERIDTCPNCHADMREEKE